MAKRPSFEDIDRDPNEVPKHIQDGYGRTEPSYPQDEVAGINIDSPNRVQPRCIGMSFYSAGAMTIVLHRTAYWPGGRILQGSLTEEVSVCERHFEDLVHGRDVPIH